MDITNFPPKVICLINIYTNNVGECLFHYSLTEHVSRYLPFKELLRTYATNSGYPFEKTDVFGEMLLIQDES